MTLGAEVDADGAPPDDPVALALCWLSWLAWLDDDALADCPPPAPSAWIRWDDDCASSATDTGG